VSEPVARSPIAPPPPVLVLEGWEVSGRRATAGLTLTDCTPLSKVQVRAPIGGRAAAELAVPFGRAARDPAGTLVAGSGPGEWLLLAAPGEGPALTARATGLAARCPGELVTATDITHGRALIRLNGSRGADVLARVCGIDTGEDITPDGHYPRRHRRRALLPAALRALLRGLSVRRAADRRRRIRHRDRRLYTARNLRSRHDIPERP
jgi:heterotetrameric sarcosine oxidase gamma subunit